MVAEVIIVIYAAIGAIAACFIAVQKIAVAGRTGAGAFVLMLIFWPFFLPTRLLEAADEKQPGPVSTARKRIAEVGQSVRAAWSRSGPVDARERQVVESFLARLEERAIRLEELRATLLDAAPSIRSRLEELRAEADREIEGGLVLLELMAAQLTLLRFTGLTDAPAADRDQVEGLLARIEAMANV